MTAEEISKILVENKYRLSVNKYDTAVFVVDIPKVSVMISNIIKSKKRRQTKK